MDHICSPMKVEFSGEDKVDLIPCHSSTLSRHSLTFTKASPSRTTSDFSINNGIVLCWPLNPICFLCVKCISPGWDSVCWDMRTCQHVPHNGASLRSGAPAVISTVAAPCLFLCKLETMKKSPPPFPTLGGKCYYEVTSQMIFPVMHWSMHFSLWIPPKLNAPRLSNEINVIIFYLHWVWSG